MIYVKKGTVSCRGPFPENKIRMVEDTIAVLNGNLEVTVKDEKPHEWANIQVKLANALSRRTTGDRKQNTEDAISHYQASLEVWTKETNPHEWATVQVELANAMRRRRVGKRKQNMEAEIAHYKAALEVMSKDSMPHEWATVQMSLGNAMRWRIGGKRMQNMEKAIAHFKAGLEVLTKDAMPYEWATGKMKLGHAMCRRIAGDRKQNMEDAIAHYKSSIEVMAKDSMPERWATVHLSIANCMKHRTADNRKRNIEDAIAHLKKSVEVWTRETSPGKWASAQRNIAELFLSRIAGDRKQNIEDAIVHYKQSLTGMIKKADVIDRATVQIELADAMILGDRKRNTEDAIAHFKAGLEVCPKHLMPQMWAAAHARLGDAMQHRIVGDLKQNIEDAIVYYNESLEVMTQVQMLLDRAMIQMNIGIAMLMRIAGDRKQNVEDAIVHFEASLKVVAKDANPHKWAQVQMNLAIAMRHRIAGDRKQNLEDAIVYHKESLKIWTKEELPHCWAEAQVNLGNAMLDRIAGDRRQNIEDAISYYMQGLEVYTKDKMPEEWAMVQVRVASAMRKRIAGDREQNIESAIARYIASLEVITKDTMPDEWAIVQMNLGNAKHYRISGARKRNIDDGIAHFNKSHEVWNKESMPHKWAILSLNLANAYFDRSSDCEESERSEYLRAALEACAIPNDVINRHMDPLRFLRKSELQSRVLACMERDEEALVILNESVLVLREAQNLSAAGYLQSRSLAEEYGHLFDLKAGIYLRCGDNESALKACDAGKAAFLRSLILEGTDVIEKLTESDRIDFEKTRNTMRSLKHKLDRPDLYESQEREKQEREYLSALHKLQSFVEKDTESQQISFEAALLHNELSLEDVKELLKERNSMCIYMFFRADPFLKRMLTFFCIWDGNVHVLHEPSSSLTTDDYELLFCDTNGQEDEHGKKASCDVERLMLGKLGELIGSLMRKCAMGAALKSLVIVPHRSLHRVPFAAVPIRHRCESGENEFRMLGDILPDGVFLMPSLIIGALLYRKETRATEVKDWKAVLVKDTRVPLGDNLSAAMSNVFGRCPSVAMNSKRVRTCDLLLYYGHGTFASGGGVIAASNDFSGMLDTTWLSFSDSKRFSLVQIWNLPLSCRIVVAVACRGAEVNTKSVSDECLSIGTGFLVAGAKYVVCSLWPVDNVSAIAVINRFCKNIRGNQDEVDDIDAKKNDAQTSLARCLAEAQCWYRDLSEEDHKAVLHRLRINVGELPDNRNIRNWAAFVLVGPP